MVMGTTGSRLVSGGMKPPASTFPAVPLPSTPSQHACQDMRTRGVHHLRVGACNPGSRREVRPVEVWGCIHAGLPRDAATDPTGQPSGFPYGPNISGQYRYT